MPKVLHSGCIVSFPMGIDEDFRHLHLFSLGNYMYQIMKAIKVIQWPGQSVNE